MDTIKSRAEISLLFSGGKRYTCPSATVLVGRRSKEHDPRGRVAFVAGKKLGGAVWRNRAKRRLRAVCHDIGGPWPGYDVVFIAKSTTTRESYSTVCKQCNATVLRAMKECDE